MYQQDEFEKAGFGFIPSAAGKFSGDGTAVDLQMIPRTLVFSCILEGAAQETTENGKFLVKPGEMICLRPGTWHCLTEHERLPLTSLWLNIEGPEALKLPGLFGFGDGALIRKTSDAVELNSTFAEIFNAFNSERKFPAAHFLSRLFRLAELCRGDSAGDAEGSRESLSAKATSICKRESMRFPTIPELAERLGVCQNTLLNACRSELGISTVQLLLSLKLERAKELLVSTNYKLSYIALACGFKSPSHFICRFRKSEGMTPSAWRDKRKA